MFITDSSCNRETLKDRVGDLVLVSGKIQKVQNPNSDTKLLCLICVNVRDLYHPSRIVERPAIHFDHCWITAHRDTTPFAWGVASNRITTRVSIPARIVKYYKSGGAVSYGVEVAEGDWLDGDSFIKKVLYQINQILNSKQSQFEKAAIIKKYGEKVLARIAEDPRLIFVYASVSKFKARIHRLIHKASRMETKYYSRKRRRRLNRSSKRKSKSLRIVQGFA